ncbi:AraC family transcriptional regulator [Aurantiacibacter sp. MUD11]|uniref:helix-turn-helix transcriptional regulator n=1 Tax=Aurantiacibacter sp. MUD11 TaxID=3003265 RepID=UPI0022AAD92D|nr:AraC family transcriptional regulator [Aurantiacibacter sp. MUD11]WAT16956.1 AraC family transcriptional regulator [Aurantiacibacter sp. MUD11]
MAFSLLVSRYLGRPTPETRVQFGYSAPAHADRLCEVLEGEVVFDAPYTAILVPRALAHQPNIAFDHQVWQTASEMCAAEQRGQQASDPLGDFALAFEHLLAARARPPRLGEVAEHLGISQRTLIRRLQANGWTFARYREARLQPRLEQLLADPSLTLEEVASRLGFSDSSAFARSFKRRFGQTPGQFRKALDVP